MNEESAAANKFCIIEDGNSGEFFIIPVNGVTTGNDKVMLSCQFSVNKLTHSEKSYDDLREIFNLFSQYNNEPLTFKKAQ